MKFFLSHLLQSDDTVLSLQCLLMNFDLLKEVMQTYDGKIGAVPPQVYIELNAELLEAM